jgi:hypothetical protein
MSFALTDAQFEKLELQLKNAGLNRKALFHDLLDHYYCLTTMYMDEGQNFETASKTAFKELAPDGFSAIEQELQIFLNFNIHLRMNRILYSGAFLAALGQTLYVLFKTLHWPGANIALMLACAALFFMVLPVWILQLRSAYSKMPSARKIRIISGLLAISFFALGSVFKIQHYIGANALILLGTAILAILFFPLFFWEQYKEAVKKSSGIPQTA